MNNTALPAGNRWAVVLSTRAVKQLRKIQRDQKALEIVHKRIRELSTGKFSDDSHRPIIGTLQHVPMFRAKVSLDLRIIYQIDVLPDPTGTSRAQIDYQFWAKVSVQLQKVNSNYRKRCQYRLASKNPSDDKQRPAMFPHEEYGLGVSNEDSGFLLDELTEEERERVGKPYSCEHERKIVSHRSASIVIGRSGTGKTTALIYKIRAVDQENTAKEDQQPIRQMFVTRSRVLAQHVESTYQGLAEFTNIALKSEEELEAMAKQSREDPDRALVEFDTEVDLRADLPSRYSDLDDSHFPLFISFDKLCSLLESDIRRLVPGQLSSETLRSLIGFDDFLHNYWPSVGVHGLEPNLVWSEIIGVIKGSQAAFNSKNGYLSRDEYVEGLSQRQFSLLASVRSKVYSIFELYNKRKAVQYDTDEADRTRVILQNLPKILGGPNIDYFGDSAQTITAGSLFRINDLKAFTYQDQVRVSFATAESHLTLSGIVRFARSLVQAIHNLFPQTIDLMEPERAKQYGDPPVFFTNIQSEIGYFEKFLLGSSSASNRVVFGAQQAILVRDAAAAEELDARLQGLCNILPITDSKGQCLLSQLQVHGRTTRCSQASPPVLCSELKLLYVAVTRARRRCWIWDSGILASQLQTEPASRVIGQLAVSSSKAQWLAKGREYFSHRLYKLAAACFRQAGQINDSKLSTAYHLMSRAKLKRLRGDTPDSRDELAIAATELVTCAKLPGIGNPRSVYFHAATCFQAAQRLLPAASAFVKAGQAKDGIHMLFEAHDYKSATDLLVENRESMDNDVFEKLREVARVYLFEHREYNVDEKIIYARQSKYRTQLKHILAEHRRYDELAEEYLVDKNLVDAVKYFVKSYRANRVQTSIVRAAALAIDYTESVLLIEGTYRKNDYDLAKSLVEKVQPFASFTGRDEFVKVYASQIDLFHSYLALDYVRVEMVRAWDQANQLHESMRMLASYLVIKSRSWSKESSAATLLEYLDVLESFKTDVLRITNSTKPCKLALAQKLFGFTPIIDPLSSLNSFRALGTSLIAYHSPTATRTVSGDSINTILCGELPRRLHAILESIHNESLRIPHIHIGPFPFTPATRLPVWSSFIASGKNRRTEIFILYCILGVLDVSGLRVTSGLCDYTTVGHKWLEQVFKTTHPATGMLPGLGLDLETHENGAVPRRFKAWLERDWVGILKTTDTTQSNPSWSLAEAGVLSASLRTKLILPLQSFCKSREFDRVERTIGTIEYILDRDDRPDATVMISFIEAVTREIVIHLDPARQSNFEGLLLPFSWAQSLARRYKSVFNGCSIGNLDKLFRAMKQISTELRFGPPGRCWCISIVIGHMKDFDKDPSPGLKVLRGISSDEMPVDSLCRNSTATSAYHAFSEASSQQTILAALCQTLQHESLVLVQEYPYCYHPAKRMVGVRIIPCNNPSELFKKLGEMSVPESRTPLGRFNLRHTPRSSESGVEYSDDEEPGFSAHYSSGHRTPPDDDQGELHGCYWH
ncbi:glycosyl hydrolases family 39 domain-containing protein [Rhizoctonia solani AG-1 IA]|uniref:Glycosyl hydrolases family 39 domain-containing protein n=1 Tax=Thanatephorus cucumeris (strain AG1-IA) TaxID=983506 RepID=L8WU87_THACA|nr:glycosyl hydrolases family 39 domain-containing protein [Rhizoctonia solani AG-1 IA]